ncbi:class I SAM-dependent methyltransferase [Candidatus Uhrbacteria bacterium]|nr:class I SAM-dependent methyltransferase [Candidatus Uhrbacteria bacterium]
MLSRVAKKNLKRDKNVLGKKWLKTYGQYFSDPKNIHDFVHAVTPRLPNRPLNILYVASASGLLGEALLKHLGRGRLTLVDISQEHLEQNINLQTKKIRNDLLKLHLTERFDLIIMRSSLDYFPSRKMQVKVLGIIKRHLKKGGLFINQPAYITDLNERDAISALYCQIRKIGDRFFQSSDLADIYAQAGFKQLERIGTSRKLIVTEADHKKRYDLTAADIHKGQAILNGISGLSHATPNGYRLVFEFPVFLSRG